MNQPVLRFAPSPNGELHLGHAYSALLNQRMARELGGRLLLRIEDIDTARCSAELTKEAMDNLAWLGVRWETPVRFQSRHQPDYHASQERLAKLGLLYPCFCSRNEVLSRVVSPVMDPEGQPQYDGHCRRLSSIDVAGRMGVGIPFALRIAIEDASRLAGYSGASQWGDVVLSRRDIGTSYHIACVTDDAVQGVSHVVRGKDLEAATSVHILLQKLLGLATPHYHHHALIGDEYGRKLSKSAGSKALRSLRADGVNAADIRNALGFE